MHYGFQVPDVERVEILVLPFPAEQSVYRPYSTMKQEPNEHLAT
jgi:hypothetical protein